MTDANASEPYSSRLDARFDGSSRVVMVTVLALIAACSLAFAACIMFIAQDSYRSWRSPYPTILPVIFPLP
ncbi:hypothetical protein QP164_07385 [Sphingomonas sp. LR59]|uniref:hypothetical protein n=1 Tax=Sphingomonas sp. LR59 TaxID=3050232 RepID=UPI002FE355E0